MKKGATSLLIFIAGVIVGGVSSYVVTKDKFEKRCECCGDKNVIKKTEPEEEKSEPADNDVEDPVSEMDEYVNKCRNYRYESPLGGTLSYVKPSERLEDDDDDSPTEEYEESDTPYVISPEEFGEKEHYDTVSLMYYADQILADDNDDIIEDVEGTVGFDSLTHFGDFETDAVHVRNDEQCTDYEILRSLRTYKEVAAQRGIFMED